MLTNIQGLLVSWSLSNENNSCSNTKLSWLILNGMIDISEEGVIHVLSNATYFIEITATAQTALQTDLPTQMVLSVNGYIEMIIIISPDHSGYITRSAQKVLYLSYDDDIRISVTQGCVIGGTNHEMATSLSGFMLYPNYDE